MTFVQAWTNSTPADPLTITISPSANSFLIAHAITDAANAADLNTTPSGWTQAFRSTVTTDNQVHQILYKVADGTETSVVFDSTSGNTAIGCCLEFSSIDTTTPLDVTPVTFNSNTSNTTTTLPSTGSMTPVTDGCDIVFCQGQDNGNSDYTFTFSTVTGTTGAWTTRTDQRSGFMNCAVGSCTQTTAGSFTAKVVSTSGGRSGIMFALRPSGGGGGGANLTPAVGSLGMMGVGL